MAELRVARLHHRSISALLIGWRHPLLSPSLPPSPPPSSLCKDSLRHVGPAPRSAYKGCVMQLSGHKRNFTHQQEETGRGEKPLNLREKGFFFAAFSSHPEHLTQSLKALTGTSEFCLPGGGEARWPCCGCVVPVGGAERRRCLRALRRPGTPHQHLRTYFLTVGLNEKIYFN